MDGSTAGPRSRRWLLACLVMAAIAVTTVDGLAAIALGTGSALDLLGATGVIVFGVVGGVILDRRPGEPVGRVCLGIGFLLAGAAALRLVVRVADAQPGTVPPSIAAIAVVASTLSTIAILLGGPLLISRFPVRSRSVRWQRFEDGLLWAIVAVSLMGAIRPGQLDYGWLVGVPNPFGITGAWNADTTFAIGVLTYGISYLVMSVGLIRRYRAGSPIVRAQVRWFAAAIGLSLGLLATLFTVPDEAVNEILWVAWIISLSLPPIAIAIAILRYHLFDIDRIISNAIGYGVITAVLFLTFAMVNLVLVSQVSPLVNNEDVAVAMSTLLVAALFNPLRRRVQGGIDRRFHRARYDADRMVNDFAARLRDELDLPTLTTHLAATTAKAVEPTSTALWLRNGGRGVA